MPACGPWIEQVYHHQPHAGLGGKTPLQRYRQDLARVRTLGSQAAGLDALFYHRIERKVRKDATVSYRGARFEVPYALSGQSVRLVVDPHAKQVIGVEDEQGVSLDAATPLDLQANARRPRRKPQPGEPQSGAGAGEDNEVELAYRRYHGQSGGQG